MSLPILDSRSASSNADLVRLFHQTEERWTEHLADPHLLDIGTAYSNPDLPTVYDANNIRDAALPEAVTPDSAVAAVTTHYAQRNTKCAYWVLNPSAPERTTKPLAEHLQSVGHRPSSADIMLLTQSPRSTIAQAPNLKIIPARASFRHARMLAEECALAWNTPQLADAFMLHLDDPHWDAILALQDAAPVAYVGVLAVGEIGRIEQVHVSPNHRRQGIGQTMLTHILDICARSLFRYVMLSVLPDNTPAINLYTKLGFSPIGHLTAYLAPNVRC